MVAMPNEDMRELMALAWDNFGAMVETANSRPASLMKKKGTLPADWGSRDI
jgi:hypothetical protein